MLETILTLTLIGFAAGFTLSIPVAGPIAALVVTESLKHKLKFARRVAAGSSFVEFFYVFIAMFGITYLIKFYQPFIPYLFVLGGVLISWASYKIYKTKFKIEEIDDTKIDEQKGGFRTGMALNILNPTLFFGWLTTSFIILSFASSIGLKTGGMDILLEENVAEISQIADTEIKSLENQEFIVPPKKIHEEEIKPEYSVIYSFFYALGVSFGSFVWFYLFSNLLVKHKEKIKTEVLNILIKIMGIALFGLALFFLYKGIILLSN